MMEVYQPETPSRQEKLPLVPCLPLDSAQTLLGSPGSCRFHRLLLPFDDHFLAESDLDKLLDMTRRSQSDLILLHVGHDDGLDEEQLFTALRGLQAHAQHVWTAVTIECLAEDTAVNLLDYAYHHHIDLIVLPEESLSV